MEQVPRVEPKPGGPQLLAQGESGWHLLDHGDEGLECYRSGSRPWTKVTCFTVLVVWTRSLPAVWAASTTEKGTDTRAVTVDSGALLLSPPQPRPCTNHYPSLLPSFLSSATPCLSVFTLYPLTTQTSQSLSFCLSTHGTFLLQLLPATLVSSNCRFNTT